MRRQLFTIIILVYSSSSAQTLPRSINSLDHRKTDKTLIDSVNKIKFILDSTQTLITALDFDNNEIWSTGPHIDNKIPEYRIKTPLIVHFVLGQNNRIYSGWDKIKDVIYISYNNSQFGMLDINTGKYMRLGQD